MKRNISTTKTKLWREKPQAFGRCDLGRVLCVSQIISYCQRLFSRRYPLLDRMKFVETNYSTWCISQSPLILLSLLGIIPAPLPGWPRCHGYANGSFDNEIALENILRRLLQLNSSDVHVNEYSLMTAHIWVYGGRSISEIVVTRRKSPIPPRSTDHSFTYAETIEGRASWPPKVVSRLHSAISTKAMRTFSRTLISNKKEHLSLLWISPCVSLQQVVFFCFCRLKRSCSDGELNSHNDPPQPFLSHSPLPVP